MKAYWPDVLWVLAEMFAEITSRKHFINSSVFYLIYNEQEKACNEADVDIR